MTDRPKISVIIAAYRPGDGFLRVIESLDAQTLPQDEFETIVIDDGSPDDTFARLQEHAASRPNMTVRRIENSGWPSRPRNLATEMARGEWVLFMDHDDSLYPDALRRAAEYAAETDADLLSPKESKTSDVWWGMPALEHGNVPNALETDGIDALLPMVPHKFYRRSFLTEHGIRFPEGRRMLWEDIYVNVEAWRHAKHVAVLADTPVYLWHSSATNNSKTYGPRSEEFWDRIDDLMAFIDRTLDAPGYEDARRSMLLHQYRGRVVGRFSRMLAGSTAEETAMALARARKVQETYIPLEWEQHLGAFERARAVLVRDERVDLLQRLAALDGALTARVEAQRAEWRDGVLRLEVRGGYQVRGAGPAAFRRVGDRVLRVLPDDIAAALPTEVLDVTDRLGDLKLSIGTRHRADRVTWELPRETHVAFEPLDGDPDAVTPVVRGTATLDLATAALGKPLSDWVWDQYAAIRWEGLARGTALKYAGPARAALVAGRAAVAYRNQSGNLALDTAGRLRNVVKDSRPQVGDIAGTVQRLVVTLPEIAVTGTTELPATVVLSPLREGGAEAVLHGVVRGGADGARLEAEGSAPAGTYRLAFGVGEAPALPSVFVARVDADGAVTVLRRPLEQPRASVTTRARSWGRRTWRRIAAAARQAGKRIRARR